MINARERLKLARQRSGKSPEQIASAVGINTPSYYDLELVDGEIDSGLSLRVLQKLATELGIQPSDLFTDKSVVSAERISLNELVSRIKKYLAENHMTVSEFEEIVGFGIGNSLEDTSSVLDWDIECLQSICTELGVDWKCALP